MLSGKVKRPEYHAGCKKTETFSGASALRAHERPKQQINTNFLLMSTMSGLTPTTDDVPAFCRKTIPVKARIQGTVDFLKRLGIKAQRETIFRYNGISCDRI